MHNESSPWEIIMSNLGVEVVAPYLVIDLLLEPDNEFRAQQMDLLVRLILMYPEHLFRIIALPIHDIYKHTFKSRNGTMLIRDTTIIYAQTNRTLNLYKVLHLTFLIDEGLAVRAFEHACDEGVPGCLFYPIMTNVAIYKATGYREKYRALILDIGNSVQRNAQQHRLNAFGKLMEMLADIYGRDWGRLTEALIGATGQS